MLNIILGRSGSGKTKYLLEKISDGAKNGAGGQILIVPEQYSHEMERSLCKVCGDEISRFAEVLSFTRLSNRLFSQIGGLAVQSLDQGGRLLTLCAAVEQIRDRLTVYQGAASGAGFLENLLTAVDELKSYGISPDKLLRASEQAQGSLSGKLKDLSLALEAYDAVMEQGKADPRDRIALLAEGIAGSGFMEGRRVFIDGFSDFTGVETAVLEAIIKKAESVAIALTCDTADDDGESIFNAERQTVKMLVKIAGKLDISWTLTQQELSDVRRPELAFLEQRLFHPGGEAFCGPSPSIGICAAPDRMAECRWIAGQIRRLVLNHGYRYRDIAISAGLAAEYADILSCVFEEFEIPIYVNRMTDIIQKPVIKCVVSAVEAATGGFEYEDMFSYLKTGLSNITYEECDELENYVIRWSIRGNMWAGEWKLHPRGFGLAMNKADAEKLAYLNGIRGRAARPLFNLKRGLSDGENTSAQLRAVYDFLEEIGLRERLESVTASLYEAGDFSQSEEYTQLWSILCGVLDQFHQSAGELTRPANELPPLLRLAITQYDVGAIPVSLDSVMMGDIFRMRHRNVKCLFVAGATFDAIPSNQTPSGLISEPEREALKLLGISLAPGARERLDSEMSAVYSTVTSATELLYVSYPKMSAAGEEMTPSFAVRRLELLFPGLERFDADTDEASLYAERPAFRLAVREGDDPWSLAAEEYFRGEKGGRIEKIKASARIRDEALSAAVVKDLYGDTPNMSATRLEQFSACHFSFFMKYGLRAAPREKSGFEAPEYGTFIHYVLENVARRAGELGGFSQLDTQRIRELSDYYVNQYIEDILGGLEDKTDRFCYLFRRLKRTVRAVVENAACELAVSDFQPLAFELSFSDEKGRLPSIEMGENALKLSGFVDRVDGYIKDGKLNVRVVDYKTGRKAFDLTEIWHGMGLQMLIYLFAIEKKGAQVFSAEEIIPAGVLYFPAREVIVQAERGATEEEIEDLRGKQLRRSGLILDDADIISAMEHFEDGAPKFIPVKLNKDRQASGALASASQLGKLSKHVDKTLARIAAELKSGGVEVNPYFRSSAMTACDYCRYFDACHLDTQAGAGKPRYFFSMSQDDFWRALEEDSNGQAD